MIPIRDENSKKTFPIIVILILLANIAVFVQQYFIDENPEAFVYRLGAIPWEITHFEDLPDQPLSHDTIFPNLLTLVTSMFIHGGLLHLLGNLLYLWIFGDNVEALTGHVRFIFFYLACGFVATLTHVVFDPNSTIPMVGASGAISGILGAYLVRFPKARIHVLFIFFILIRIIRVPAVIVLGFWFLMQIANGVGTLSSESMGGVAWFAHIGGFVAGILLIPLFEVKKKVRIVHESGWF